MDTEATDVKVARLEVRVESLKTDTAEMKKTLAGQDEKLDKLLAIHHQRKGAQAALKFFMAAGGSSGFAALLAHLWDKFHP